MGRSVRWSTSSATAIAITACRDSKDNKFLEVAVAGRADVIVTGDEDLKVLDPFEGISIIKPSEFLRVLRQSLEPKR
jgi:predicted nucleic acid-binding protein